MKYPLLSEELGVIGDVYGTPKDFKLHNNVKYINNPIPIPRNPAVNPRAININLKTLKWNPKEKSGIANEEIPVIATTIIRIGLTIPALTAASPKIKAPTIPIVEPIGEGTLKPASLIISNEISGIYSFFLKIIKTSWQARKIMLK